MAMYECPSRSTDIHGGRRISMEIPADPWTSMVIHYSKSDSHEYPGWYIPWISILSTDIQEYTRHIHEYPQIPHEIPEYQRISMDIHGHAFMDYPCVSMDNRRITVELQVSAWIALDIHRCPWMSEDFHGHPYILVAICGYHGYLRMDIPIWLYQTWEFWFSCHEAANARTKNADVIFALTGFANVRRKLKQT